MSSNCKSYKKMKAQIHCPVSGCLYSCGSERHFSEKRFLTQHIAKVHAEKKFSCAKCQKSFGLDWWRKHHEKTCGIEWKCECGGKYASRESLLTHARRNQHKLPDYVISSDKMKQSKATIKPTDNPVILLIQPIIQNVTCLQPMQTSVVTPRPILPKTKVQSSDFQCFLTNFSSDQPMLSSTNQLFTNTDNTKENTLASSQQKLQNTVATQTADNVADNSAKLRQSQASQCTRRKPKSLKVGIESTHTQTAESAVVKIKRKRSRRKSVAITTEPSMLTDQMLDPDSSFWPGFQDFFLQHADSLGTRLFKNSISTQTTSMINNKVLCDSETLTDKELLKFPWDDAAKDKSNESSNAEFQMLNGMGSNSLSVHPSDIDNTLPNLNLFSNNSLNDFSEIKISEDNGHRQSDKSTSGEKCSVFLPFGNCDKSDVENKVPPPPTLSDIHTQTMASAVLDYNLLANMETQTTDDFTFSDLEFSDTETQTPWEDFPNIDDSPLQIDQLSIEIQTDFSSFGTGLNLDPYELINSVDMQNMITGSSSKETAGVNTETQTLDRFGFPQFTNSESQTLDISDFMDSLNT